MMKLKDKFRLGFWNVGIIENSIDEIMEGEPYTIRWMRHKYHDRFFADTFIKGCDADHYYLYAEELIFREQKGTIVELDVDRKTMELVKRQVVVSDEYHLSYPNFDGTDIVAENYKAGGLFEFDLKGGKKKILDVPLIDPTFVEYDGYRWIFATTKEEESDSLKKLSIFYEENGVFHPHSKNPVKDDIHTARPGGKFFWYKGELYRPAQNSEYLYGEDIRIMKINKLTKDEFEEEQVLTVHSHNSDRYNLGLHTFNIGDGFIAVDGFEYRIEVYQKIKKKLLGY